MRATFAVAPNFHCAGSWMDRLLVAEGDDWRAPHDAELAGLVPEEPDSAACLFVIPVHLRARFWAMLSEHADAGTGDFASFADDLSRFLAFKELTLPPDAEVELLVQDASGRVDAAGLWALVNLGEEPVLLGWPQLRLRLSPGEGCRINASLPPDVVPPEEEPNVLVTICSGAAAQSPPLER